MTKCSTKKPRRTISSISKLNVPVSVIRGDFLDQTGLECSKAAGVVFAAAVEEILSRVLDAVAESGFQTLTADSVGAAVFKTSDIIPGLGGAFAVVRTR